MGKEIKNIKTTGDEVFGGRHTPKKSKSHITQRYEPTAEQTRLLADFTRFESGRGIRKIKGIAPHLKPLFEYLKTNGIDPHALGIKGAQDFQTHLATLPEADGRPHYATLTVKAIIEIACRFYNFLKATGLVPYNPFLRIKRIKTERKLPRNIPVEQKLSLLLERFRRFWEQEHVRDRRIYYKIHVIAELMYATGMRITEVMTLREKDIDFQNRTIHVTDAKKGRIRTAFLNEYAATVLQIYLEKMRDVVNVNKNSEQVFGLRSNTSIVQTVNKFLIKEGVQTGIGRFTSHNFRHSLGFHLLRRGCDMRYIQLILGHEDMNTTTIYTKVEKNDLKKELDRFHPRAGCGSGGKNE